MVMSKLTDTEIDAAIASLTAKVINITTINLRKELKTGSFSSIQNILRQRGFLDTPNKEVHNSIPQNNINELLANAKNDLALLQKKEYFLKQKVKTVKQEITEPLASANAVLEHYIKRIIKDGMVPDIPLDLIKLLELYMDNTKLELINHEGSYYTDVATKLARILLLSKDLN